MASARHKTHGSSPSPDMLGASHSGRDPTDSTLPFELLREQDSAEGVVPESVTSIGGEMPHVRGEDRQKGCSRDSYSATWIPDQESTSH